MNNLKAEMARIGATPADIKNILGCTERTARNKINGRTEFTVSEAIKVHNEMFSSFSFEYLFDSKITS